MEVYKNLNLKNLENEIWKVIIDFPDYQVSNLGRIKSFKQNKINGKIRKQKKNKDGYLEIDLCKNGISKTKLVHRLVYENFKEKLEEKYDAHHINGDREYNFINNLEPVLHSEHSIGKIVSEETKRKISKNHADFKGRSGIKRPGEDNQNSKLKDGEVWLIKKILNSDYYKSGKITQKFIGNMFGVVQTVISKIKLGKSWSHIKYLIGE